MTTGLPKEAIRGLQAIAKLAEEQRNVVLRIFGGADVQDQEGIAEVPGEIKADLEFLAGLPENWDEEGGGPYHPEQLERVEKWWQRLTKEYYDEFSAFPPIPEIGHVQGQSIDFAWNGDFSLLVNVPEDASEPCTYYGFSIEDPHVEYQGKEPLESIGAIVRTIIRHRCV